MRGLDRKGGQKGGIINLTFSQDRDAVLLLPLYQFNSITVRTGGAFPRAWGLRWRVNRGGRHLYVHIGTHVWLNLHTCTFTTAVYIHQLLWGPRAALEYLYTVQNPAPRARLEYMRPAGWVLYCIQALQCGPRAKFLFIGN